jgi:hypothetical protein
MIDTVEDTLILCLHIRRDLIPVIFSKLEQAFSKDGQVLVMVKTARDASIFAKGQWGKNNHDRLNGYATAWYDALQ